MSRTELDRVGAQMYDGLCIFHKLNVRTQQLHNSLRSQIFTRDIPDKRFGKVLTVVFQHSVVASRRHDPDRYSQYVHFALNKPNLVICASENLVTPANAIENLGKWRFSSYVVQTCSVRRDVLPSALRNI